MKSFINKNRINEPDENVTAEVFDINKSPSPKIKSEISVEVNRSINEPSTDIL